MIGFDVAVITLLIAFIVFSFKFFKKHNEDILEIKIAYVTLAILWVSLSIAYIFFIALYFRFRITSNIPTLTDILQLFDIASGVTLEFYFWVLLSVLLMIILGSIIVLLDFLNAPEIVNNTILVVLLTILVVISSIPIIEYVKFKTCNAMANFTIQSELILFGKSASSGCSLWGYGPEIQFKDFLSDSPVKISKAYSHFSNLFISMGAGKIAAKIGVLLLAVISLTADVLGIIGFIEAKKKKAM